MTRLKLIETEVPNPMRPLKPDVSFCSNVKNVMELVL